MDTDGYEQQQQSTRMQTHRAYGRASGIFAPGPPVSFRVGDTVLITLPPGTFPPPADPVRVQGTVILEKHPEEGVVSLRVAYTPPGEVAEVHEWAYHKNVRLYWPRLDDLQGLIERVYEEEMDKAGGPLIGMR